MDKLKKSFYASCVKLLAVFFVITIIATPLTSAAAFSGVLPVASTSPLVVTMSDYELTTGQTAVVTFTFSPTAVPASFDVSQITVSDGSISDLTATADPLVYTATFTPTSHVSSANNTISVNLPFATTSYALGVGHPQGIAFDGTNMWTANNGGTISKITPTGSVTSYALSGYPIDIAFDGTDMWVVNYYGGVFKVSSSGATTTYLGTGTNPRGIAFDGTDMWIVNASSDSVTKMSSSGATTTYDGVGSGPFEIAFDGTNMWTANYNNSTVTKISPIGATTTYPVSLHPISIAFDGTNMWTTNVGGGDVTKVTPLGATTTYAMPTRPNGIAFDGTNMWTGNDIGNSVTKISPDGVTTVVYGIGSGTSPGGIAFDGVNIWTSNYSANSVTKITPAFTINSSNYTVNTKSTTQTSSHRRTASPSMLASTPDLALVVSSTDSGQAVSSVSKSNVDIKIDRDLDLGMEGEDVKKLQEFLINKKSGPISLELARVGVTGYFGIYTKNALGEFQKSAGILPHAGYFGPITRALLK